MQQINTHQHVCGLSTNITIPSFKKFPLMVAKKLQFVDFYIWPHDLINIHDMSTKINRVHLLNMGHPPIKYGNDQSFPCWVILHTNYCSQNYVKPRLLINMQHIKFNTHQHVWAIDQYHHTKFQEIPTYGCQEIAICRFLHLTPWPH